VIQYADAMETSPFPRLFVLDLLSTDEKASLKPSDESAVNSAADEQVNQCPLAAADAATDAQPEVVFIFQPLLLLLGGSEHWNCDC